MWEADGKASGNYLPYCFEFFFPRPKKVHSSFQKNLVLYHLRTFSSIQCQYSFDDFYAIVLVAMAGVLADIAPSVLKTKHAHGEMVYDCISASTNPI